MLHLKKHFTFFASPTTATHQLALSPILDDDDELIQEINNQAAQHDDNWSLTPTPDTEQLASFWQGVQKDIENDPLWERFDDSPE